MENTDYAGECVATHRFEPVELLLGEPKFIRSVASLSYTIIIQHDTNPHSIDTMHTYDTLLHTGISCPYRVSRCAMTSEVLASPFHFFHLDWWDGKLVRKQTDLRAILIISPHYAY